MPERTSELNRLSAGERACLRLLATGHDIKSLAAELGISVAAATERLRSARAKLGVTSSREAARLLLAGEEPTQKTWPMFQEHDLSGQTGEDTPDRREWLAGKTGISIMILVGLALTGAALISTSREAAAPPRVVAASPANGAVLAPGNFTLSVTFDQPMAAGRWSFVAISGAAYPNCSGKPVQSADRRTFSMQCSAVAGSSYAVGFNGGRYQNFRSASGRAAVPYVLRFRAR